jgi:phage replication O-like protein O
MGIRKKFSLQAHKSLANNRWAFSSGNTSGQIAQLIQVSLLNSSREVALADVQLEKGYFRVANGFWEAICRLRIPGEARQVFDFILRQTWGWKKREDRISLSQFVLGTGLSKKTVIKARKKLLNEPYFYHPIGRRKHSFV